MISERNRHLVVLAGYVTALAAFGLMGWLADSFCRQRAFCEEAGRKLAAEWQSKHRSLPSLISETVVIGRGSVIGDYLGKYGISAGEMEALLRSVQPVYNLARIKSGQLIELMLDRERLLRGFRYHIDADSVLEVERVPGSWSACKKEVPYRKQTGYVAGVIEDNLFNAIERQGEMPALAVALAELFAWDVDFYSDLRRGDSFRLLVRKKYLNGQFMGYGPVLAAEFVNQGHAFQAVRFVFPDGHADYFTPSGESVRKELLKSPLKMGTVTSRFSNRRLHPSLKVYRPHFGVDIAAPVGTPVHAAGDGAVSFLGSRGQAGRMLEIRHANGYHIQYLHLSRYRPGLRRGDRVRQGEAVAYVGSTGESTGPHLDYRIKQNNRFINPMKQQFQRSAPLPSGQQADFLKIAGIYLETLAGAAKPGGECLAGLEKKKGEPPVARQFAK